MKWLKICSYLILNTFFFSLSATGFDSTYEVEQAKAEVKKKEKAIEKKQAAPPETAKKEAIQDVAKKEEDPKKLPEKKEVEKKTENKPEDQTAGSGAGETQAGSEEAEKTLKIGNLAFPVSQQPTPLISFGQNLLDKKQLQGLLAFNELEGSNHYMINFIPSFTYNFTDSLALSIFVPIAVRYRQDCHHATGPEDTIIQFEYAFYTKAYATYYDQATIVTNLTIPTGSYKKNPPTGIGANSFFIGGTYSRLGIDWYYFGSTGGVLTTTAHRTTFGDQFLYQLGIGRRLYNSKEWLFLALLELDGTYSWRNVIKGTIDKNSGGNVIYLTPSLFISSIESLVFHIGFGFPVEQHLFGKQEKNNYLTEAHVAWTF